MSQKPIRHEEWLREYEGRGNNRKGDSVQDYIDDYNDEFRIKTGSQACESFRKYKEMVCSEHAPSSFEELLSLGYVRWQKMVYRK